MTVRMIGAGLPRTGTASLRRALEQVLNGACHHMSAIPGHPFDLGPIWDRALNGHADEVDWTQVFEGYVATVDWPASQFWPEISAAFPDALIVLSERDSAHVWWESMDKTVLKAARKAESSTWTEGRDLVRLLEDLTGTADWDDAAHLQNSYTAHNSLVRLEVDPERLFTWKPGEGWNPICRALGIPVPDEPFPWLNRRSEWG